ncbi:hypothetical protein RR48_13414 [Papilio machaon]|uniref:Uncharacterized protein n=1 Tax=Papilio machaon TaxID=76193 RepID=A0A194QXU2_PAPMA|nr:hypothetical protein RR48_13414 [Papilio machaon]
MAFVDCNYTLDVFRNAFSSAILIGYQTSWRCTPAGRTVDARAPRGRHIRHSPFATRLFIKLLLTCLVYVSCVQGIMVKYGTKGGPIEPPTPEPTPAPQPYRIPAPVWEERSDDSPDPNATWAQHDPFIVGRCTYNQDINNLHKLI